MRGDGLLHRFPLCIGCKACEVACKQWNGLPADGFEWTGKSYDNTRTTFRDDLAPRDLHRSGPRPPPAATVRTRKVAVSTQTFASIARRPLARRCAPRGADPQRIRRCVLATGRVQRLRVLRVACPFGVLGRSEEDGRAHECTLCYDRQKDGIEPACAKACPTELDPVWPGGRVTGKSSKARGRGPHAVHPEAYLYGESDAGEYRRLNAFFLLLDEPAAYNLPEAPTRPSATMLRKYAWSAAVGLG